MKKLKKYKVTYRVCYMGVNDRLEIIIGKLKSEATVSFNVEASNQMEARQVATDEASRFLGEDFIIRGKNINSFKPLSIEEIK